MVIYVSNKGVYHVHNLYSNGFCVVVLFCHSASDSCAAVTSECLQCSRNKVLSHLK